jgi:hypothetical protein
MGRTEHADVDAYIADQPESLADRLRELRAIIREEAPDAVESIKWGHPNWEIDGNVCYVSAFTEHVNLGFFRGADLEDPNGLLEGTGKKLRHVKVRPGEPLPEDRIRTLLREAFELEG